MRSFQVPQLKKLLQYGLFLSLCIISSSSLLAHLAHAQLLGGTTGSGISIVIKPEYPRPGDVVTVTTTGYSYDSYRSDHQWLVDGQVAESGTGKRTFSFRAGPLGSRTTINLIIQTEKGGVIERDFTIAPSIVAITWEGDTYTPPLYKGVAQHTPSSFVRFVAVPSLHDTNGSRLDPSELVYLWKLDDRVQKEASGIGRTSFRLENTRFTRSMNVSVEVSTYDRSQIAVDEVTVPTEDPRFVLYQAHPLLGVLYERALGTQFTVGTEEVNLVAEPYYYSLTGRDDLVLSYDWQLNRQNLEADSILTLRPDAEGAGAGSSVLTLIGRHSERFMQSARASLTIQHGTQ